MALKRRAYGLKMDCKLLQDIEEQLASRLQTLGSPLESPKVSPRLSLCI